MTKSKTMLFKGESSKGTPILIRYPTIDDAALMCAYINRLSAERTFVSLQGELRDQEEDKKFLEGQLQKVANGKAVLLVCFSEETLIGQAEIVMKSRNQKHVGEFSISIDKGFRSEGMGTKLMEVTLAEAKSKLTDLKTVVLSVFANNSGAIKLYEERFGFKKYGVLPNSTEYQRGLVDYVLMYREL